MDLHCGNGTPLSPSFGFDIQVVPCQVLSNTINTRVIHSFGQLRFTLNALTKMGS